MQQLLPAKPCYQQRNSSKVVSWLNLINKIELVLVKPESTKLKLASHMSGVSCIKREKPN